MYTPTGFLLSLVLFTTACSNGRHDEIKALAPRVPDDCIRHLLDSDDEAFARYAREMGTGFLYEINMRLGSGVDTRSVESFERTRRQLVPLMFRVTNFIQSERGDNDPFPTSFPTLIDTMSAAEAVRRRGLAEERSRVLSDTTLSVAARVARLAEYARQYDDDGMPDESGWCWWRAADLLDTEGNREERLKLLVRAAGNYRQTDRYRIMCQLLGVLGSAYEDAGHVDSMWVAFDEGRRIADRLRLPNHAARIRLFEANYYRRNGRLSLAHDLYNEAQEICREYGGGHYELRYVYEAMRFYAQLGAWEIVEPMLHRAHALLRGATVDVLTNQSLHRVRVARLEAQHRMAIGQVKEANALFEDYRHRAKALPWKWEYALYLLHWSQGLLDNDLAKQALPLISEGLALGKEMNETDYSARFAVLLATAHHTLGDLAGAAEAIVTFNRLAGKDPQKLRTEWVRCDVLAVRVALEQGDTAAARQALAEAVTRFRTLLAGMDASAHGYLWMSEFDELRQLMHELAGDDPTTGYGIELYWRECAILMGGTRRGAPPTGDDPAATELFASIRAGAIEVQSRMDPDDVHCLFADYRGHTLRWTCRADGIRLDGLSATPPELAQKVSNVWREMATAPASRDERPSRALVGDLTSLGVLLLPDELRDGRWKTTRFLVSAAGALARLPFETLNVASERDYLPLIAYCDVAYVRHASVAFYESPTRPGVIFTNADIAPSLRRRHPFQQAIPDVDREGRTVAAAYPDATVLMNDRATKANLAAAWEHAAFVYIATHVLRDPQAPYYALIPMVAPPSISDPHAVYLDIADVRAADFTNTGTVVLSGCSSTSPYVGTRVTGASIGDAFLDAGAAVVVGTFWDVRDDYAAELMVAFVGEHGLAGASAIEPLSEIRRRLLNGPQGVRHPFHWASYSINLGRI